MSIEQLAAVTQKHVTALLFLHESRQLDPSLLYAYYLLKYSRVNVIYLGNDVSISNLSVILDTTQPDFVYTYFPANNDSLFEQLALLMDKKLPEGKLLISLQTGKTSVVSSSDKLLITGFDKAIEIMCRR